MTVVLEEGSGRDISMAERYEPIRVSKRIEAEPSVIFATLSNPSRHKEFDGSAMVRDAVTNSVISDVGDEFEMNMYFDRLGGDYKMINRVVEFEPERRIAWEPAPGDDRSAGEIGIGTRVGHRWAFELEPDGADATIVTEVYDCSEAPADLRAGMDDGRSWEPSMVKTLDLLEELCAEES
jgi:Activator of Hsp90 ATPase homolog 1-like protein